MDDHPLSSLMYSHQWIEEGNISLGVTATMCERCGDIYSLSAMVRRNGRDEPLCLAGGIAFGFCPHLLTEKDLADLIKALQRAQKDHVAFACRCVPPDGDENC